MTVSRVRHCPAAHRAHREIRHPTANETPVRSWPLPSGVVKISARSGCTYGSLAPSTYLDDHLNRPQCTNLASLSALALLSHRTIHIVRRMSAAMHAQPASATLHARMAWTASRPWLVLYVFRTSQQLGQSPRRKFANRQCWKCKPTSSGEIPSTKPAGLQLVQATQFRREAKTTPEP